MNDGAPPPDDLPPRYRVQPRGYGEVVWVTILLLLVALLLAKMTPNTLGGRSSDGSRERLVARIEATLTEQARQTQPKIHAVLAAFAAGNVADGKSRLADLAGGGQSGAWASHADEAAAFLQKLGQMAHVLDNQMTYSPLLAGKRDALRGQLQNNVINHPDDPLPIWESGWAELYVGRREDALRDFAEAIHDDPQALDAWYSFGLNSNDPQDTLGALVYLETTGAAARVEAAVPDALLDHCIRDVHALAALQAKAKQIASGARHE